jgi:hypothetical protein
MAPPRERLQLRPRLRAALVMDAKEERPCHLCNAIDQGAYRACFGVAKPKRSVISPLQRPITKAFYRPIAIYRLDRRTLSLVEMNSQRSRFHCF